MLLGPLLFCESVLKPSTLPEEKNCHLLSAAANSQGLLKRSVVCNSTEICFSPADHHSVDKETCAQWHPRRRARMSRC